MAPLDGCLLQLSSPDGEKCLWRRHLVDQNRPLSLSPFPHTALPQWHLEPTAIAPNCSANLSATASWQSGRGLLPFQCISAWHVVPYNFMVHRTTTTLLRSTGAPASRTPYIASPPRYCRGMYLARTLEVADLILNAVALTFVKDVDELMFTAICDEETEAFLDNTAPLVYPKSSSKIRFLPRSAGAASFELLRLVSICLITMGFILAFNRCMRREGGREAERIHAQQSRLCECSNGAGARQKSHQTSAGGPFTQSTKNKMVGHLQVLK